MLNNNKIQIAMLEISDQNKAVLDFYFNSAGKDSYNPVTTDKADAYICDYDYPGAKDTVAQLLEANEKPVIILSIKEQNIPLTLWLAKPLSAAALTEAAEKLKQMISDIKTSEIKEESSTNKKEVINETKIDNNKTAAKVVTKEALIDETSQEDTTLDESVVSEETEIETVLEVSAVDEAIEEVLEKTQEEKLLEEISNEIEEPDFFELLAEANQEDENDDEVVELVTTRTENLVSLNSSLKTSAKSLINVNAANLSEDLIFDALLSEDTSLADEIADLAEEKVEKDSSSKQEFTDVVVDNQNFETDEQQDSESEMDALLESLIKGGGVNSQEITEGIDTAVDTDTIASDALVKDIEVDDLSIDGIDISDSIVGNDEHLQETVIDEESAIEPNEAIKTKDDLKIADVEETKNDVEDDLLFPELDSPDKESTVVDDKQSLEVEENFLLHDDLNPSDEDIYTETLEVNYSDVKTDDTDSKQSTAKDKLIEVKDFDISYEDTSLELSLEPSSEIFNEDTNDTTKHNTKEDTADLEEQIETDLFNFGLEPNNSEGSDEFETIPSLTVIERNDKNNSSLDLNVEILDTNSETDIDLDSLLNEVSIEGGFEDESAGSEKPSKKASFSVADVKSVDESIEQGFDKQADAQLSNDNSPDFKLQSLLNEIREEAGKSNSSQAEGGFDENGKPIQPSSYETTEAEKRWTQLCGVVKGIDEQKQVADISFNPENHLLGAIIKQIQSTKNNEQVFRLKYKDLIIVIDHSKNKIYCNLPTTTDDYSAVCFSELNPLEIKIHDLDYSEVRSYRTKIEQNTDRAHSIESFVWTTSLLTSQGRLPKGTDITKVVALKVWPDLTRLELMPHAMHIAAVFNKHPGSLIEMAKCINIHQRYVFAFYNAAMSLNMVELDSSKIKKGSFSFGKKGSNKNSEERGFFGRLLKRLKS